MSRSSVLEPKEVFQFRKVTDSCVEWVVPTDLPYLEGHFPGNPVVPGVAMIDASLEATRILKGLDRFPWMKKLHSAKYTGLIRPGDTVEISLEPRDERERVVLRKAGVQTTEIIFEI